MMAGLFGGILLALLLGWVCVWPIWRAGTTRVAHLTMLTCLGMGLGLGLSACVSFTFLVVRGGPFRLTLLEDVTLLACLGAAVFYSRRPASVRPGGVHVPAPGRSRLGRTLLVSVAAVVALALGTFTMQSLKAPHGTWDAWAIWNLRARLLFGAGSDWMATFTQILPSTHPDYPLLLPVSVARLWSYAGVETRVAPVAVAMLFTFSTVALLGSAVASLRSASQGMLAVLLLLGLPAFVVHGASQTGDIPVGFFLLAALTLFCLPDRLELSGKWPIVLAGLAGGLAAWTKNEGLLIVLVLLLARCVSMVRAGGWNAWLREMPAFLAGLMPVLLVLAVFKVLIAPPNDIMAGQGVVETMARLATWTRYSEILRGFRAALEAITAGALLSPIWLLVVYVVSVGLSRDQADSRGFSTACLAVSLLLAGYAMIYLITPLDLAKHLRTSADRLLLQVWPSVLFVALLVAHTPEEASS